MSALFTHTRHEDESEWLSISDLMAGLMVVFLFIAVVFIRTYQSENEQIREIAVAWEKNETAIYDALTLEFEKDLDRWNAEIDRKGLAVRFKAPDVLFEQGEAAIRPRFAEILDDFFPRYVEVLSKFKDSIEEVRIEGHTSSDWAESTSESEAYFQNMGLSQARTRAVLEYGLEQTSARDERNWLVTQITANGLSSSRLIRDGEGREDAARSRRVEFRIRTVASTEIVRILEVAR